MSLTNPVMWIINLWNKSGEQTLKVGSRIKTKYGMATVLGGSIHVRTDAPAHMNQTGFTFNIGKEM